MAILTLSFFKNLIWQPGGHRTVEGHIGHSTVRGQGEHGPLGDQTDPALSEIKVQIVLSGTILIQF